MSKTETPPLELLESSTDEDLMALVRKQNQTAFDVLICRHEEKLYHLAWSIVRNRDDASDIVQDVFLKLWDNPGAWKPKHSIISREQVKFTTWLFRVITNKALNVQRSKKIRSFLSFSSETEYEIIDVAGYQDSENEPDKELVRQEDSQFFERAFNKLAPKQKAALHLRYRENLSVGEIAKSLDVSYKSAESLLFRGKARLKEFLKK